MEFGREGGGGGTALEVKEGGSIFESIFGGGFRLGGAGGGRAGEAVEFGRGTGGGGGGRGGALEKFPFETGRFGGTGTLRVGRAGLGLAGGATGGRLGGVGTDLLGTEGGGGGGGGGGAEGLPGGPLLLLVLGSELATGAPVFFRVGIPTPAKIPPN